MSCGSGTGSIDFSLQSLYSHQCGVVIVKGVWRLSLQAAPGRVIIHLHLKQGKLTKTVHHCLTTSDSTNPSINSPIVLAPFTIPEYVSPPVPDNRNRQLTK